MSEQSVYSPRARRDAIVLPLFDVGTSVFGGFVSFSVLGHMAWRLHVNVTDVVQSGPGLVFTVYPEVLSLLPLAPLWALLFFLMLFTLSIDSEVRSSAPVPARAPHVPNRSTLQSTIPIQHNRYVLYNVM